MVTAFLSLVLIITRNDIASSFFVIEEDLFRITIIFFVSTVAILFESIEYSQESLKNSEEKFIEVFNKVNDVAVVKLGYSK